MGKTNQVMGNWELEIGNCLIGNWESEIGNRLIIN